MEVKSLNTVPFSILMDCFLAAFKNYYVKMPIDHSYYKERWRTAKVDFDLSYGMFDNEKLVGFIIHAIDHRNENIIAFNTGTGVLPKYRRLGIVSSIYKATIPKLQEYGVSKCRLEVIKENQVAIKVYERIGFSTTKGYKCFGGEIQIESSVPDFELQKVAPNYFNWNVLEQESYSWDNHYNTVSRGVYDYYVVSKNGTPDSYFVINSENGYVAQFNILSVDNTSWIRLFTAIRSVSRTIKINNVNEELVDKLKALQAVQMKNTVDQYEMEMLL